MCLCGCVIEVAAVGAATAYVAKKCLSKGKKKCECECHKQDNDIKDKPNVCRTKSKKQDK